MMNANFAFQRVQKHKQQSKNYEHKIESIKKD